jgi:hygromycin-B 7''-O-kinase
MPRDVYLQPDTPDPELAPDVVLALARRHVPTAREVVAVDESGGEARTYAIADEGEELIFKVQRPQQLRPRTSLEKEVFFLRQIAELAPELPVPRVRGTGRENRTLEYTLMTRMPGTAMRHALLTDDQRDAVLWELGRTLRRIHALPLGPFGESNLFPGDYAFPSLQTRFGEAFLDLAARQQHSGQFWPLAISIDELGRRVLLSLPRTQERAALHSNPYREHVFVHAATRRFTGVIDFGDAYVSHQALDLRRWHLPAERSALLAGYTAEQPVSEDFLAVWRAVMILADASALVNNGAIPERIAGVPEDLDALIDGL